MVGNTIGDTLKASFYYSTHFVLQALGQMDINQTVTGLLVHVARVGVRELPFQRITLKRSQSAVLFGPYYDLAQDIEIKGEKVVRNK